LRRRPREPGARVSTRDDVQRLEGIHPALEALRAGRRPVHRLLIRRGLRHAELGALKALAEEAGIPELPLPTSPVDPPTRGVVLEAGPLPELSLEELVRESPSLRTLVALDGVEDPQNLGAIARVAEGAGALGLVLTRRRAPPLSPSVARASAGAIEWLPVARVPNLPRALAELKDRGFWVFGADPSEGEDLFGLPDRTLRGDRVVVFGAEGRGLRPAVGAQIDHRIRIPLTGHLASLNVSAAAAVLLFELHRRHQLANSP
jgi:23S rRNA (guanosine2251-2'-O)-methyltransferase